jgi:hypothetical protein
MAALHLSNGTTIQLPGLGKTKPVSKLSEKRITRAVRDALRKQLPNVAVRVSCSASYSGNTWAGQWWRVGVPSRYTVK